jgi:hypothetical protein
VRSLAKKKGPMTCVRCQYGCQNRLGALAAVKLHVGPVKVTLIVSRARCAQICCPACSVRKLHDGTILMIIDLAIIGIALLLGEPLASPRTLRAHQLTIWTSRRAMLGK